MKENKYISHVWFLSDILFRYKCFVSNDNELSRNYKSPSFFCFRQFWKSKDTFQASDNTHIEIMISISLSRNLKPRTDPQIFWGLARLLCRRPELKLRSEYGTLTQERSHRPLDDSQTDGLPSLWENAGTIYRLPREVKVIPAIDKDYGHAWNVVEKLAFISFFFFLNCAFFSAQHWYKQHLSSGRTVDIKTSDFKKCAFISQKIAKKEKESYNCTDNIIIVL